YTSQAEIKRMNRRLELLYRETEWLNVLKSLKQFSMESYPAKELTAGWKIILRNQFHDIIPGSSINEVYKDAQREHAEAEQLAIKAWDEASSSVMEADSSYGWTLFNSAPWKRNDNFFIKVDEEGTWHDDHGNTLVSQRTEGGYIVQAHDVPSMGYASIFFKEDRASNAQIPFESHTSGISTPYYEIAWNEAGQLTKLYDKTHNREVLAEDSCGNVLQTFEDKPIMFDAWDIDIYYQEILTEVTQLISAEFIEAGALQPAIRFTWKYGSSLIAQDMTVYATSRRIDLKTYVDWQERQRLLKVAFPVEVRSTEATYDIQYGNVKRPTHWNTSWDYARFETVGHQWADLSEGGYGVSLLNDSKYGYDIKDHVMRLSLLKSPIHPDPYGDLGEHNFTYSLLPHENSWVEGNTVREAWQLNNPLTYKHGEVT